MAALAIMLHGCFTGVESTPKITATDVKKEKIPSTPEQSFLDDVAPQPPAEWQPGKLFFVSDPKAAIIFTASSTASTDNIAGNFIRFSRIYPVKSVTSEEVTEIEFLTSDGGKLYYRDNTPYADVMKRTHLELPFLIEQSVVDDVKRHLIGKTYYVITQLWYSPDGTQSVNGLRHVPVKIVDVVPGNAVYPIRVVFRPDGQEIDRSMYMTLGNNRTSTRNFHTLFTFDNPKEKYPHITDEVWDLIRHSRVRIGMTREECKLALGAPQTIGQRPYAAGMFEYWQYGDGVYLLFEDDYLNQFLR